MKIAFISQPEYFRFVYENDLDSVGKVREFIYNFSMTGKDFASLEKFDADVNFFFRGEFFPEDVLRKLNGIKVNLSSEPFPNIINGKLNYTIDSLKRYKYFRPILKKSFDYIFHYDRSSLPFIERDGINLSGEFCFPVATGIYKKQKMKKKWDFFFVGRSTPHRELFFSVLKHRYNFLHICHGLWGEELNTYMNQSKILLNVHAESETSWEPRVQMMMASGNMVISEKITKNPYLIPGRDYVEVTTPQEMLDMAKYYFENKNEREKIATRGMEKIQALFDSKKVFNEFLKGLNLKKYNRVSITHSQSSLLPLMFYARLRQTAEYIYRIRQKRKIPV